MVQISTMPSPEEIYSVLEVRRAELGLSQAEVGARAFGKADNAAFQALRRGSSPSADKLAALCQAVGWEFYFGPPRETRRIEHVTLDGRDFTHVPLHQASLAAGGGADNEGEDVIDHLAFRRAWLKRIGVSASNAVLARACGDSMLPSIHCGDLLLIDRSKREIPVRPRGPQDTRPAPIYALLDGTGARVKRIERPNPDLIMLLSDNPSFPPEILSDTKISPPNIIGKVVWWGHTNRD